MSGIEGSNTRIDGPKSGADASADWIDAIINPAKRRYCSARQPIRKLASERILFGFLKVREEAQTLDLFDDSAQREKFEEPGAVRLGRAIFGRRGGGADDVRRRGAHEIVGQVND